MKNLDASGKNVSVVIPAYNEEKYIEKCIRSVQNQDGGSLLEIIVADNGSSDATAEIAEKMGCITRIIDKGNVSELRNAGALISRGDFIAFLDADCMVPDNWLKNALMILSSPGIGLAGCSRFRMPPDVSWIEKSWKGQKKKTEGLVRWVGSGNMVLRRETFFRAGGFNSSFTASEDIELCRQLRVKLKLNIYSSFDISVTQMRYRKNLREFFRKELWHGREMVRSFLNNPRDGSWKLLAFTAVNAVSGLGFVTGLLGAAAFGSPAVLKWALLAETATALAASASRTETAKNLIPLAFLYMVYGSARAICLLDLRNWSSGSEIKTS